MQGLFLSSTTCNWIYSIKASVINLSQEQLQWALGLRIIPCLHPSRHLLLEIWPLISAVSFLKVGVICWELIVFSRCVIDATPICSSTGNIVLFFTRPGRRMSSITLSVQRHFLWVAEQFIGFLYISCRLSVVSSLLRVWVRGTLRYCPSPSERDARVPTEPHPGPFSACGPQPLSSLTPLQELVWFCFVFDCLQSLSSFYSPQWLAQQHLQAQPQMTSDDPCITRTIHPDLAPQHHTWKRVLMWRALASVLFEFIIYIFKCVSCHT